MYATFDIDERTFLRIQRFYLEKAGSEYLGPLAATAWSGAAQAKADTAIGTGPAAYLIGVAERVIAALNREVDVEIGLADEDGFPHKGKLNFMDNRVDPNSVSVWVRGVLPNPDRLLTPGLFVRVRLPVGNPYKALLIPERALTTDQGQKFVYVIKSVTDPKTGTTQEQAEYRRVELGDQHGRLRVVRKGIEMGERIIVSNLQRVRTNMEVVPQHEEKASPTDSDTAHPAK
jgi:RND family efflux transporter MFP subunit